MHWQWLSGLSLASSVQSVATDGEDTEDTDIINRGETAMQDAKRVWGDGISHTLETL